MIWMRFPHGYRLDPIAKGAPEALVVLLHDLGASAGVLMPIGAYWAAAVPTTACMALDGFEGQEPARRLPNALANGATELVLIERATRNLEPVLEEQLCQLGLSAGRLVLVGFGYGATLALHMSVHQGWSCAGVLAFAGKLLRPLPRVVSVTHKVRLIGCAGDVGHSSLRDDVALLTARGIDTRGVLLSGSPLSQEAVRHGGAYLVELVATAQRGDRCQSNRGTSHAR